MDRLVDAVSLLDHITNYPDWPSEGIVFRDLNPIYRDPALMREAAALLAATARSISPDGDGSFSLVVAPEARGFILGPMLAREIGAGFVPVRKPEKLPPPVRSHAYELEFGPDTLEIQEHPLAGAGPILIYDDVLATGGTATATARLVEALDGQPAGFAFLLELGELNGRSALEQASGMPVAAALTD